MRRLTDEERDRAGRMFPEAIRLCRAFAPIFGVDESEADSAASLAAMSASVTGRSLESRCFYRVKSERRASRPRSARGRPDFLPLPDDTPEPRPLISKVDPDPRLTAALRTLPPRRYLAIELAVARGLGCTAAGRAMGVRKQTVQLQVRLGLATLRTLLEHPA